MLRRIGTTCLLAVAAVEGLQSQSATVKRAAETITEADVRRRIFLIADDSMGGRATPSPGLTKTANYLASEFQRFGLKPGGDSGTYLLSYPLISKRVIAEQSTLQFGNAAGDRRLTTTLAEAAVLLFGPTRGVARGEVVLISGAAVPDSIKAEDVKGRIVIYVLGAAAQRLNAAGFRVVQRVIGAGAAGVVLVVGSDSVFSTSYAPSRGRSVLEVGEQTQRAIPVLALLERGITEQVPEAALQFEQLRSAPATLVQPMPDWSGEVALKDTILSLTYAPNVVGVLEGSDPVLKHEYVVYSAHMDHIGIGRTPAALPDSIRARTDTINNGADDDASGTVAVVELAEAFSQKGVRPKRSLIFLTVSGEERGLWGSDWFAEHAPVPLPQIVANLNIDMIGRNWKDTIVAIGKEHSDLGSTLHRVNAAHPELNMVAIDDRWPQESFFTRSDHYNFARRGVPILFFFNGVHADYHQPSDSPDKIDAEKESRIVQLLFYLGLDVANAPERPKWVAESHKRIVTPK